MHALRLGSPVRVYTLLAIVVIAAVVPFAHVLGELYDIWNLKPEYSHGIIIPLLSAYLIWRQRAQLRESGYNGSWLGLIPIGLGLVMRYVGELTTMHTFEHYALLLVVYGLVLTLVGPAVFRQLWAPLLLLVFALPLPTFFNSALSLQLQLLSSELGVRVIRAAGISVLLEGNVIDLGSYQLEVAEACSGLRYLFPLLTLALIVAYLFRGPLWQRAVIFLSSIPITVVMNSLRIGFIGITVDRWGRSMAEGALHEFEGWLVFMLSTGALILTAYGLSRLGSARLPWREVFTFGPAAEPQKQTPRSLRPAAPATVPHSFIAAALLLVAGAAIDKAVPPQQTVAPARTSLYDFPMRVGNWVGKPDFLQSNYLTALRLDDYVIADYQQGGDSKFVNFYAAYYQSQDTTRAIHSPHDCMPGGGWQITEFTQRSMPATSSTPAFRYNRAVIQLGSVRQVAYYWFQERGRRMTSEQTVRWYLFWDALTRHRTDGALVRLVAPVPIGTSEADADARLTRLALTVEPMLSRYVPD